MAEITGAGNATGVEAIRLAERDNNTARLSDPTSDASQELAVKDRVTLSAEAREAVQSDRAQNEAELEQFQSTPSQNNPGMNLSVVA